MPMKNPTASQPTLAPSGARCSGGKAANRGPKPPQADTAATHSITDPTSMTTACSASVTLTAQNPPISV